MLRLSLLLIIVLAVSCTAGHDLLPPRSVLPFPAGRSSSALTELTILGRNAVERFAGTDEGDSLRLAAASDGYAWALYHFTPNDPFTLTHADISLTGPSGSGAWVCLANYSTQRWEFHGPYTASTTVPLDMNQHLSPINNVFVAVVTSGGNEALVDRVVLNADDSAWKTSVVVGDIGTGYSDTAIDLVYGKPAFAYCSGGSLYFVRASDIYGETWGEPQVLAPAGFDASMSLADLGPAIAYINANGELSFIASLDVEGAAWGSPVVVDPGVTASHPRATRVNLHPAVVYSRTSGDLMYVRDSGFSGSAWGAPQVLAADADASGSYSIASVAGQPGVSYRDYATESLRYMRALDQNGDTWGMPLTLDSGGGFSALAMVDDFSRPAIAYSDNNQNLMLLLATDLTGSGWNPPQSLDVGASRIALTYFSGIPGRPWLAWQSVSGLQVSRAADQAGASWETPHLLDRGLGMLVLVGLLEVETTPGVGYIEDGALKFARLQ